MAAHIRAFNWAATPLGPISGWSSRLKLMVEQVLASPLVASLTCGPERVLIYNAAAAELYGDRHPAALGRPLPETFAEGWATVAPFYERGFAGEAVSVARQPLDTRGEGEATEVFDALLMPVHEEDGRVAYVHMTGAVVSVRRGAEIKLRESEAKYRQLFATMGQGYSECEVLRDRDGRAIDYRLDRLNPAFERLTGIVVADAVGRTAREILIGLEDHWIALIDRVVRSGLPEQVEYELAPLRRWYATHVYPVGGDRFMALYEDITDRKRAEHALRESEERKAFLLRLSDALRHLTDAVEVQEVASRMVGEHLRADRVAYSEVEGDELVVYRDYAVGAPSMVGRYPKTSFGQKIEGALGTSGMVWANDVQSSPDLSDAERAAFRSAGIAAYVGSTLYKDGQFAGAFGLHQTTPRIWTEDEISLVEDVAERIWAAVTRARTEAALRKSEERFAQFASASAAGLWIRQADTLAMEFVSPAVATIYGVEADALLGDVTRWAAIIVPEDRDAALSHLDQARHGEVAVYEFRIQRPADGTFRWIRNTDFPLRDERRQVRRIGGIAEDVTEAKLATEHSSVLLAELQHRVRNIMGMIRSMTNRTAPGAMGVEDYRSLLEGRLLALARVQALLTREANAGGSLKDIIENEVVAQAHHGGQFDLTGPDITLSPKAVEVLTLAFHELATNGLKYGALSVPEGRLSVRWALVEKKSGPWLSLDWVEAGAPSHEPSTRRGFGSELVEARIPYELSGKGKITIAPGGAQCHLEFPLKGGESILETDAPPPTIVFGGSLDMTGAADLTGRVVLVVEDDYYLAHDTAAALRSAGADVLGPCPSEAATLALLKDEAPTHAVLDLNLGGGGPRFEIAHLLKARGIPFVFLTGYDPDVIPEDMHDVVRLQKPLPYHAIVEAVGQL